jgi:TonB family protein
MRFGSLLVVVACLSVVVGAQSAFKPAQYVDGQLPVIPLLAVSGGEVFLELAVTSTGQVASVKTLRTTPPFTDTFMAAVQGWRFRPAEQLIESTPGDPRTAAWTPVDSMVLVAGIVGPPSLNTPTLGQPPQDVAAESDDTPFPINVVRPAFPPLARDAGLAVVEASIDVNGRVAEARAVRSAPAFDPAALTAARAWTFRPARVRGRSVSTYAYLIFAFRPPVTVQCKGPCGK